MRINEFREYIRNDARKTNGERYSENTVNAYVNAVIDVCERERIELSDLAEDIENIVRKYDRYGEEEEFGDRGHKTVINGLYRFQEFVSFKEGNSLPKDPTTDRRTHLYFDDDNICDINPTPEEDYGIPDYINAFIQRARNAYNSAQGNTTLEKCAVVYSNPENRGQVIYALCLLTSISESSMAKKAVDMGLVLGRRNNRRYKRGPIIL